MIHKTFSRRNKYRPQNIEITLYQESPEKLRCMLINNAYKYLKLNSSNLREFICEFLNKKPNDKCNWGNEYIKREINDIIFDECEWYDIYDLIEHVYKNIKEDRKEDLKNYRDEFNEYFYENGIGWQIDDVGLIKVRGNEFHECIVKQSYDLLNRNNCPNARKEIEEAYRDLSRRPEPDITGAIQHSMAALECVARNVCGNNNMTLGKILKNHKDLIPEPLNTAVDKLWGYSSDRFRHLREQSNTPSYEEVELIVSTCASVITYLIKKKSQFKLDHNWFDDIL